MSIDNIQKLKKFGIFQNHTNAYAKDFGKYNLFYGWNGSGKSTLSGVFRCVENSTVSSKFPFSEFTVSVDNGALITQANVANSDLNIYTFNHDFIEENISWDSVVKSILLVDKEKIEEREKLEKLKKEQEADSKAHSIEAEAIRILDSAISKFGTDSARHMKTSLQSIDTTDRYYLNYDKRKFEKFINDNLEVSKSDAPLLDDQKIVELTNAAKPDQKSPITFNKHAINQETFRKAKERLDDLLKTSVVSQTIQRLVDHGDIKSWVESGLDLHKRHDTNQCEFCGNTITEERTKQLEAHFNDDYKAFQTRLESADGWLASQYIQSPTLPAASDFYDEFKNGYNEACTALRKAITGLNEEITVWHDVLKDKTANPLETGLTVEVISESSVKAFNDAMTAIGAAVEKHNHKSGNFKEETDKAKKQLELHYATTEVKSFGYHDKKKEVVDRKTANGTLKATIDTRNAEIRKLEDSLSNEGVGADQFNESLHKFLGRSELTLRFNPVKKGYEILRNNSEQVDGNLSEGEKTAIAFVYFITKLKENDNNIEDTIVVVDDPISSFDSNHLFHAYSFMKKNCDKAKQLFVFTHNFTFFKLVRDWISRKNKRDNQNIANFYVVKSNNEVPRTSTYADAEAALTLYNSEYHYIFSRLHSLKNQQALETDDHFLAANLARKLLESFLSFKFPKNRGNFANLFNTAVSASQNPEDEGKEKIRKFINEYSHNDLIETNEDFVENLIGEGVTVISDIFDWIHELDEKHYQEMMEVVS
ncbi:AAA family ATPase [Spongiibacter sp. UBA1325]|uniref:AAA family ATPase n=1 Tax=Spongiibacter sp. UBA1325 TaxID=1947543 RepID=UPI00257ED939|nr:AAA family ATPase [Spongiibacter sp. UBA1325]|tara:strand:- start:1736 stop:4027 length:2292 start_codon:yes stop_codon:yes gene_type:complete